MADLSPVLHNPEPDGGHFLVEFFGCDTGSLNSMSFWKECSERDHELYDRTMLHRLNSGDRRLLIIGGGDGYIAATAMHLNPSLEEITVVDLDGEVVNACRAHLHQTIFDHAGVNLVVQDALQLMEQHEKGGYDGIICDLTASPVGYRPVVGKCVVFTGG